MKWLMKSLFGGGGGGGGGGYVMWTGELITVSERYGETKS